MLFHVAHVAVHAGFQPGMKMRLGCREVDAADSDLLKAQLASPHADRLDQFGILHGMGVVRLDHGAMITAMNALPHTLYTSAQVGELDRLAMDEFGLGNGQLMERAGLAAFTLLQEHWPRARRLAVICGTGNNGGDGFVLARLASKAGLEVQLLQVGDAKRLRGDALAAAQAAGMSALPFSAEAIRDCDLLVDALLGSGLQGELAGEWRAAVEAMNASGLPLLALDIPSGLNADLGTVQGCAVRATRTITFIGLKQGLLTADGPAHCGELHFAGLGVPDTARARVPVQGQRLERSLFGHLLPLRSRTAHKGDYGHVLVVGGAAGYAGAARLAGEAAVRCGAGLVSIATQAGGCTGITAMRPELMCHAVSGGSELQVLLQRATVVLIGPGLGQQHWAEELLSVVLESSLPLVVDADALNLLAAEPAYRQNWILTPHPGEAGRLLGVSTKEIQQDRFAAAAGLQASLGGVVVLKGPGTLVLGRDGLPGLCAAGNPGMASGGMGDVLGGVIAALLAQGLDLREAAALGVCLHATAADRAAQADGERGLLASDLFPHLRHLVNIHDE